MLIQVKKFGTTLSSRPAGKEAYAAYLPTLNEIGDKEEVDIDFEDVLLLGPSWADEFLTPIIDKYKDRVTLRNTENPSVKMTINFLKKIKENRL